MSAIYKIKDDLSNLDIVLARYDKKLATHEAELCIDGKTYMEANAKQAGISSYFDQLRCDLDVMLEDMDMRYRVWRTKTLKRIQQTESKAHAEKTLSMLIDGDPDVIKHYKAMGELNERFIKAKAIVTAFQQRGYSLNNIVKIRAGDFHNETMYVDE